MIEGRASCPAFVCPAFVCLAFVCPAFAFLRALHAAVAGFP